MGTFFRTAAVAIALLALTSLGARAATFTLGDGLLSLGESGAYGNTIPTPSTSFTDYYTFSIVTPSQFGAAIFNFNVTPPILDWDINNLHLGLEYFNGAVWNTLAVSAFGVGGPLETLSITYANMLPGIQYRIFVSGLTTGTDGGSYAGSFTVAAVPLPPAIILFGLGLLTVFGVSRRMKSS